MGTETFWMTAADGYFHFWHGRCARAFKLATHPVAAGVACPYCGEEGEIIDFQTDLVGPVAIQIDTGVVHTEHKPLSDAQAPPADARVVNCRHCHETVVIYEPASTCPTCRKADPFA